jgi:uncharacterized RDD family membrane protein YckC
MVINAVEETNQKWIAGFWRRIGALFIDSLILGVLGLALSFVFESLFVQMGGWGRLVGFVIALAYFGVMNSSVANGQTLGKKLLDIRVVNSSNNAIGLTKSLARYIILALPISLNGAMITNDTLLSSMIYPLSIVIFGGLLSTTYLYIFNRITRQSLHDLMVGTYVVNATAPQQTLESVWRPHLFVVAVIVIASAIAPIFTQKLAQQEPFKDLLATQTALMEYSAVRHATLNVGSSTLTKANESAKTTTYLNARVFILEKNVDDVELARNLAKVAMTNYADAKNKNLIQITLTYGFDIGIWSQWSNYTHVFKPADLQVTE